jgi:hypothetical protein
MSTFWNATTNASLPTTGVRRVHDGQMAPPAASWVLAIGTPASP